MCYTLTHADFHLKRLKIMDQTNIVYIKMMPTEAKLEKENYHRIIE